MKPNRLRMLLTNMGFTNLWQSPGKDGYVFDATYDVYKYFGITPVMRKEDDVTLHSRLYGEGGGNLDMLITFNYERRVHIRDLSKETNTQNDQ